MARNTKYHNLEIEMAIARMNQNDLATALKITPTTLSFKLNGKSELTLNECTLIKNCIGTDKTIDYLFASEETGNGV